MIRGVLDHSHHYGGVTTTPFMNKRVTFRAEQTASLSSTGVHVQPKSFFRSLISATHAAFVPLRDNLRLIFHPIETLLGSWSFDEHRLRHLPWFESIDQVLGSSHQRLWIILGLAEHDIAVLAEQSTNSIGNVAMVDMKSAEFDIPFRIWLTAADSATSILFKNLGVILFESEPVNTNSISQFLSFCVRHFTSLLGFRTVARFTKSMTSVANYGIFGEFGNRFNVLALRTQLCSFSERREVLADSGVARKSSATGKPASAVPTYDTQRVMNALRHMFAHLSPRERVTAIAAWSNDLLAASLPPLGTLHGFSLCAASMTALRIVAASVMAHFSASLSSVFLSCSDSLKLKNSSFGCMSIKYLTSRHATSQEKREVKIMTDVRGQRLPLLRLACEYGGANWR